MKLRTKPRACKLLPHCCLRMRNEDRLVTDVQQSATEYNADMQADNDGWFEQLWYSVVNDTRRFQRSKGAANKELMVPLKSLATSNNNHATKRMGEWSAGERSRSQIDGVIELPPSRVCCVSAVIAVN